MLLNISINCIAMVLASSFGGYAYGYLFVRSRRKNHLSQQRSFSPALYTLAPPMVRTAVIGFIAYGMLHVPLLHSILMVLGFFCGFWSAIAVHKQSV